MIVNEDFNKIEGIKVIKKILTNINLLKKLFQNLGRRMFIKA